jgi:hypothetical protein
MVYVFVSVPVAGEYIRPELITIFVVDAGSDRPIARPDNGIVSFH